MPMTTTGRRANPADHLPFVMDAIRARGYMHFAGDLDEETDPLLPEGMDDAEGDPEEVPEPSRSPRSEAAAKAAIADAMGPEPYDPAALGFSTVDRVVGAYIRPDYADADAGDADEDDEEVDTEYEDATEDGFDRPEQPSEGVEGQSKAYRVREGNWRDRHGLPRRRRKVPPSQTTEARRLRHLTKLVADGKFATIAEADRAVARRPSVTRAGLRKRARTQTYGRR